MNIFSIIMLGKAFGLRKTLSQEGETALSFWFEPMNDIIMFLRITSHRVSTWSLIVKGSSGLHKRYAEDYTKAPIDKVEPEDLTKKFIGAYETHINLRLKGYL